ncbi:hypothetical protein ACAG39_01640 [Caldicellulosiruptoraceae bacterium PP1]
MIETSFFGFSKREVYQYIEQIIEDYEKNYDQLEKQRLDLLQQRDKLKLEIDQIERKLNNKYQIRDIEKFNKFINDYFKKEWHEIYRLKAEKITLDYDKTIENLKNILDDLKWQIYNVSLIKDKFFNKLNNLSRLLNEDNIQSNNLLNKRLKYDFIVDDEVIIPKNVIITENLVERIKQKGLMIELLKHLAREDM